MYHQRNPGSRVLNEMRSESSESSSKNNDESSENDRDSRIDAYCTLRSRHLDKKQSSTDSEESSTAIRSNPTNFCTVGRRLKKLIKTHSDETNLPYTKLQESAANSFGSSFINFGLSNDLSTESIKNACDCFDLSDDEVDRLHAEAINNTLLEKIENGLSNSRRSSLRLSTKSATFSPKKKREHFHPYCTLRRDKTAVIAGKSCMRACDKLNEDHDSSMTLHQDSVEALNILSELDAILDNHTTSQTPAATDTSSLSSSPVRSDRSDRSEPEKIEDCLMELDAYLEEIDRLSAGSCDDIKSNKSNEASQQENDGKTTTRSGRTDLRRFKRSYTLPKKLPRSDDRVASVHSTQSSEENSESQLIRGDKFRNTIEVSRLANHRAYAAAADMKDKRLTHPKAWRRHSMRKTSLLVLPDHKQEPLTAQMSASNNESYAISEPNEPLSAIDEAPPLNLSNSINLPNNNAQVILRTEQDQLNGGPGIRHCLSQNDCENAQNLTHLNIIHDILSNSSQQEQRCDRPRQYGRRADCNPRIVSILAETSASGSQRIIINHDRPRSAPAAPLSRTVGTSPLATNNNCSRFIGSEPSSVGSSRNPSPVSLLSSTGSSSIVSASPEQPESNQQARAPIADSEPFTYVRNRGNNSQWPHGFSRILALLCCTLGLFNISRFAILTINYGGNFLLQFLILSIIFGIPMLWLQMCLGAKIKSGPISMWKISPICKGIGISLLLAQCVIALYSTISLGWVLVYFRDSFISRNEKYRWQQPFSMYRRPGNITHTLTETVADYFNGIVLQRWQLGFGRRSETGGVRFQLAFNLAIIWTVVFVILCKGLKSFGKIILGLTLLPMLILIIVVCKLLYIIDFTTVQNIFLASDFEDFLVNSKTWTAAAQETFLTWTLLGPSVIAIASRSAEKCEGKTILRRDAILVVILTIFGLSLASIFGFACIQILHNNKYIYYPGSYENMETYTFLYSLENPIPSALLSIPTKWAPHYSTVLGECYHRPPSTIYKECGYQALRLVTELFPATVAVSSQEQISPVWSIMTFLMFVMFGLAQLCAMWKPISSALGNSTSSVLLSCVTGLLLGIPFATEMGLSIIHYLDIVIGGAWWILILWTAQIFAVFLIRGRPYNGDVLVNDLRMTGSMSAFLALSWNVLLPIGLITLSIIEYKISLSHQFFNWRGKTSFHLWTRKVGGLLQVGFLLLVPITALIQIYRYLTTGPPDILDRIQLLYRPSQSPQPHRRGRPPNERGPIVPQPSPNINANPSAISTVQDDAPPKYTPPPSYTTATGARIAKMLRQSIRRSMRRLMGEPSRPRPSIPTPSYQGTSAMYDSSLPPEYSTVHPDPSGDSYDNDNIEIGPRALYNSHTQRTQSLERQQTNIRNDSRNRNIAPFTASDVAQILRSSNRHERSVSAITTRMDNVLRTSSLRNKNSRSAENLVLNAAPLGESSFIALDTTSSSNNENTSVI